MTRTFQVGRSDGRGERVERRADRDDRRLVVGGRARVEPPLGLEPLHVRAIGGISVPPRSTRAVRSTGVNGIGLLPRLRIDRLTVVVAVEQQRSRRPRHGELAVDERVAARLEQLRLEAARGEHAAEVLGVAPDVGTIRGDVGYRQQVDELLDDLRLVRRHPGADRGAQVASTCARVVTAGSSRTIVARMAPTSGVRP